MDAPLALRPLVPEDLPCIHELLSDWRVVRHMLLPFSSSIEQSAEFLAQASDESASAPWRSIVRAIVASGSSQVAGLCGIAILAGSEEGEIWYLVNPLHQGCGLATSAAKELLRLGFDDLQLHRVWACCVPENLASGRVLEKVGMRREGLRRKNLKIHGEWKDSEVYAILSEEWTGTGGGAVGRRTQMVQQAP